jgi:hypothetical protein
MEEELLGMVGSLSVLPPMARLALLRPRAAARVTCTLQGITHTQALWRGHAAQLSYQQQRAAAVGIQQRWRATLAMRGERAQFLSLRSRVVCTQAAARRWLAGRERARRVGALGVLQRWGRMVLSQQKYARHKAAVIRLQARWRGRRAVGGFHRKRRCVVAAQAAARGVLARAKARGEREGRVRAMRAHAFSLWRLARTPLVHRTRLWGLVGTGVLPLAMWGEECRSLWEGLGLVESPGPRLCLSEGGGEGSAFDARLRAIETALPSLLSQLQPPLSAAAPIEEAGGGERGSRGRSSAVRVSSISRRFSLLPFGRQAAAAVDGNRPLSSSYSLTPVVARRVAAAAGRLGEERRRVYAALKAQR